MTSVLISPDSCNHAMAVQLENSGARVLTWPALEVSAPLDDSHLREAIENLFGYDWLIFKNARAIDYFIRCFFNEHRRDELDELRVLAIGPETSEQANEFQIHVDIAVERFASNRVFDEIQSYVGSGELDRLNVLLPGANISRELFEEQLAAKGSRVDSVTAYRTCAQADDLAKLKALIAGGGIDCVAFTSAAAVNEFACLFDSDDLTRLLTGVAVVCADQTTAQAASEFCLNQTLTPTEPSFPQLVDLIRDLGASLVP